MNLLMKKLEEDSTPPKGPSDMITKVIMNKKTNQGTIIIIPFVNKKDNNFYYKLAKVREWNGHSTRFPDSTAIWYRILPNRYYGELSPEDNELLAEVNGLYDSVAEYKKLVDYKTLRSRNYTLIYGVLRSHTDKAQNKILDNVNKPCLFVFPSLSPIDSLKATISQKSIAMNGDVDGLEGILSTENTGREGALAITFDRPNGSGGYETTIGFEFNNKVTEYVKPTDVFGEEITKYFNDPVRDLLGWQNGEKGYFNPEIMKELRDDLKRKLRELQVSGKPQKQEPTYVNKNGSQDPMKNQHVDSESNVQTPNKVLEELPF